MIIIKTLDSKIVKNSQNDHKTPLGLKFGVIVTLLYFNFK